MPEQTRQAAPSRGARAPLVGAAVAVMLIALAAGLRLWPLQELGTRLAYLTFYPAVVLATAQGRLSAGLLATALSALLVVFWQPASEPFLKDAADGLGLVVFMLNCTLISSMGEAMHRARARADTEAGVARQRAGQVQEVNERLHDANDEVSRLLERTREVDRMKSRFFANISHELRTPLALILGPAQRLLSSAVDAEAQRDLRVIERNARTLLRHVNDLLDVARLEEARIAPAYAETDLAALARLVAGHFESVAPSLDIGWQVELPPALPAQVDPAMVRRVLFNLLSNAFKFTPGGACVRLTLGGDERVARFEVADGGPGIAPAWRDAVFERFRQLEGSPGRLHGGTGLGLAIARDFVLLHRGRIHIETAPEGGALFVVELPRAAPPGTPVAEVSPLTEDAAEAAAVIDSLRSAAPPAAAAAPPGGSGALVLVVEDNRDMSAFIRDSLRGEYRVATAFDGAQALRDALALTPDLIVSDVMMPGLDGEALLQAVRAHRTLDDTPVIVLSAKADDALRVRLLRNGAQDYLTKPFAVEELRARVGTLVARKEALAALRRSEEYWRGLFAQATEGIVVVDPVDGCTEVNAAACTLLGRAREEFAGLAFEALQAPGEARCHLLETCAVSTDAAVHAHTCMLTRGDGQMVAVDASMRRLSDGRCLVLLRDATERLRRDQAAQEAAEELERRVTERTQQMRRLAAQLEAAETQERRQLARDLHDDLGQTLAAARIRLGTLCHHPLADVRRAADEIALIITRANRSTRSLAQQLAPPVLYELGLPAALDWLAEDMDATFGLAVSVDDDGAPKPLSQEARSIVYRAVRELLINVAKHASVTAADVKLERRGNELRVRVHDGGVGLPPAQGTAEPLSGVRLGLASVRERLGFIGGRFEIRSMPGEGTEALLHVPLQVPSMPATPLAAQDNAR